MKIKVERFATNLFLISVIIFSIMKKNEKSNEGEK